MYDCSMKSLDTDPDSKYKAVLSADNKNYQMFAYCPTVSHKHCGVSEDPENEDMLLSAILDKQSISTND